MNPFKGRHFQRDIILWAVRWYCKYGISYRELQEMLAERGVNVDHSTIYRWGFSVMRLKWKNGCAGTGGHCCKVSDEAAFCLIQRPYISKTLLTGRISPGDHHNKMLRHGLCVVHASPQYL
jgi:hypothetical protein